MFGPMRYVTTKRGYMRNDGKRGSQLWLAPIINGYASGFNKFLPRPKVSLRASRPLQANHIRRLEAGGRNDEVEHIRDLRLGVLEIIGQRDLVDGFVEARWHRSDQSPFPSRPA